MAEKVWCRGESPDARRDSFQENQSDLEVILDFLEEYYRQSYPADADDVNWMRSAPVEEPSCEQGWIGCEPPIPAPVLQPVLSQDATGTPSQNTGTLSACGSQPHLLPAGQPSTHHTTAARAGRKLRLFHFLFEMLEDPCMAHCVFWVPAAAGVFQFSSRNKDQVAALWGQRKGNKRPMTYQKMSRALRNYAHSGEIFKVKKKLTYQFSRDTLRSLQQCRQRHL
ncbi:transcription factor Spi-B [Lampris incognitus]|uniref:transcription factor Spi-B n=1 Tax=Lampris incognitus TaxID=2546036 RepID=UPI0024B61A88|nr:transcription factor Spi-B [Lampris incognitus]